MRTTLTLEDDVAAMLQQLQRERNASLKQIVNELLRQSLAKQGEEPEKRRSYRMQPMDLGRCLIGNLDDVAEALAVAEGDDFR